MISNFLPLDPFLIFIKKNAFKNFTTFLKHKSILHIVINGLHCIVLGFCWSSHNFLMLACLGLSETVQLFFQGDCYIRVYQVSGTAPVYYGTALV